MYILLTLAALGLFGLDANAATTSNSKAQTADAYFAAGCFWCVEADFEKIDGVIEAISGYSGGHVQNPTYEQVCSGKTGHRETVKVIYDPKKVSYKQLLQAYWNMFDPTDAGGSFADRGHQYSSAIFYQNQEEKEAAEQSILELEASQRFDGKIKTAVEQLQNFYPAESYHQDYYQKNSGHYRNYRRFSGREEFIRRHLPEKQTGYCPAPAAKNGNEQYTIPDEQQLRRQLTPMQFHVTRENGTEPPFDNAYWDHKQQGIYVDIISGEPLFSSLDKFDSGTGWPSFTRPLEEENIIEKKDRSLFMTRTEVRSKHADSHLGHVFGDGPPPTGKRYCINSASLRFIPKKELQKRGYAQYQQLFDNQVN